MAPIYSTLLWRVSNFNGAPGLLYTVAPGTIVVIRSIDVVSGSAGAQFLFIQGGATSTTLYSVETAAAFAYGRWRGRQVLNAGDEVNGFSLNGGVFDITASGYIFAT